MIRPQYYSETGYRFRPNTAAFYISIREKNFLDGVNKNEDDDMDINSIYYKSFDKRKTNLNSMLEDKFEFNALGKKIVDSDADHDKDEGKIFDELFTSDKHVPFVSEPKSELKIKNHL